MIPALRPARVLRCVVLLASAAALVACSADEITVVEDDPRLIVHAFDSHDFLRPDHSIGGSLRYNADTGCMFLMDRGAKLLIWPEGTTPVLTDGERGVEVPDYGIAMQRDDIRLSYYSVPEDYYADFDGWEAAESCVPGSGDVVFVSQLLD